MTFSVHDDKPDPDMMLLLHVEFYLFFQIFTRLAAIVKK